MPYKPVQPLLTTWTICKGCGCTVAHLEQRLHDKTCPALHPCRCRDDDEPALEYAS